MRVNVLTRSPHPSWTYTLGEEYSLNSSPEKDFDWIVEMSSDAFLNSPKLIDYLRTLDPGESLLIRGPETKSRILSKGYRDDDYKEVICSQIVPYDYLGYQGHTAMNKGVLSNELYICESMTEQAMETYETYLDYEPIRPRLPSADNKWTLVTGYFDLTVKTDATNECRSLQHYLENSRGTLALNYNLVIFCEPKTYDFFYNERKKYGLLEKTKFVTMEFEEFPLSKYQSVITENRKTHPYHFDPRNTPNYYLFCMARYAMLKRVIEENPFESTHFAWVNICLMRMGLRNIEYLGEIMAQYRNKFSTLYIDFIPENLARNYPKYYEYGRCGMCSGFFTGDKEHMYEFCNRIEAKFLDVLHCGYGHADEQLFSLVYFDKPDLFHFYYGEYLQMVTNYIHVYENPHTSLNFFIPKSIQENRCDLAYTACEEIMYCYEQGFFTLSASDLIKFMENYFRASWWTQHYDRCRNIVEKVREYCEKQPEIETVITQNPSIINTTDYLYLRLTEEEKGRTRVVITEAEAETCPCDPKKAFYILYKNDNRITKDSFVLSNPMKRPETLLFPF